MRTLVLSQVNRCVQIGEKRNLHFSWSLDRPARHRTYFNPHKDVTDPARQDPDYFEKLAARLPIDDHYCDALREIWEEKFGSERDLGMKATDLLIGNKTDYALPKLDMAQPRLAYRNIEALKSAPASVKKIFSVGFGSKEEIVTAQKWEMTRSVNLHQYDMHSIQAQSEEDVWRERCNAKACIGIKSGCIRAWSAEVDERIARHKQNKKPKHLIFNIQKMLVHRRDLLSLLKARDAAAYNKVISELKLHHKPPEAMSKETTRKIWSEEQLNSRANKEKETRLSKLHKKLLEGREKRMADMENELAQLDEEEKRVKSRIAEILKIEGKTMEGVAGKYQPKLIEEFTENALHEMLFYHPRPRAKASGSV